MLYFRGSPVVDKQAASMPVYFSVVGANSSLVTLRTAAPHVVRPHALIEGASCIDALSFGTPEF